jgi:glycolate oxidase iron-sulfur subunit
MPKMQSLVKMLQELEDQLAGCMRCGLCQSVCPLFAETGREADVARGKLALLDGLSQEMFKDPQGVSERLNRCLLCGSCAANCPSGVRVLDIFIKARAILSGYMGLSPVKKAIFRGLLAKPELFNQLLGLGARFQGIFVKPVDDLLGSSCSRFLSPVLRGRHFKPLAATPLHKLIPSLDRPAAPGQPKVALFVGCLIDKIFPQVGQSVLTVLEHHGVGVLLPAEQGCCGIPALSSGDTATFIKLLRHNLELFRPGSFDYLVTACATCTSTLKKIWPLMARDASAAEQADVAALADKTLDISQFLVDKLGITAAAGDFSAAPVPVTYHDPCHLKKSLGVAAQPRALLQADPGLRLREMAESDWCCGCGGSFNLQNYEISARIGKRKADNILASGAGLVATGCPACMLQITDLLSQAGAKVQVKHVLELYAAALAQSGQPAQARGTYGKPD